MLGGSWVCGCSLVRASPPLLRVIRHAWVWIWRSERW